MRKFIKEIKALGATNIHAVYTGDPDVEDDSLEFDLDGDGYTLQFDSRTGKQVAATKFLEDGSIAFADNLEDLL
jgi:hypothetical protein